MSNGNVLKVESSNYLMMVKVTNPQRHFEALIANLSLWPCVTLLQHAYAWYSWPMASFFKNTNAITAEL